MPVRSGYGPSVSLGLTTHDPDGVVVVPVPVDVPPLPVFPVDGPVGDADPQPAIAALPTAVSAPRICRRLKREPLFCFIVSTLRALIIGGTHATISSHNVTR